MKAGAEFVQSGKLDEALGGGKVDGSKFALYGASAGEFEFSLSVRCTLADPISTSRA